MIPIVFKFGAQCVWHCFSSESSGHGVISDNPFLKTNLPPPPVKRAICCNKPSKPYLPKGQCQNAGTAFQKGASLSISFLPIRIICPLVLHSSEKDNFSKRHHLAKNKPDINHLNIRSVGQALHLADKDCGHHQHGGQVLGVGDKSIFSIPIIFW